VICKIFFAYKLDLFEATWSIIFVEFTNLLINFGTSQVELSTLPFDLLNGWVANATCVYSGWFLNNDQLIALLDWDM